MLDMIEYVRYANHIKTPHAVRRYCEAEVYGMMYDHAARMTPTRDNRLPRLYIREVYSSDYFSKKDAEFMTRQFVSFVLARTGIK